MAKGRQGGGLVVDINMNGAGLFGDARRLKGAAAALMDTVRRVGEGMDRGAGAWGRSMLDAAESAHALTLELRRLDENHRALVARQRALADGSAKNALPGEWLDVAEALRVTEARMDELSARRDALTGAGEGLGGVARGARSAAYAMRAVGDGADRVAARLARLAGAGASGFLKRLAGEAQNAAVQLAKLSARALSGGLKRVGGLALSACRGFFGLGGLISRFAEGTRLSLKRLAKYGFGIRTLYVFFNRLRSAVSDSFEALALFDGRVRAALDALGGSLGALKRSLAAAFAPVLTAAAPALTTLINLLTRAMNAVGMFMAALTGQAYYTAAAGIGAVGGAASGASGSVKDLKRQLAGFDELNILGVGGSGGAGGGGGNTGAFEVVPIDGGIARLVERLKALFAAGEYEAVGGVIADGINRAFKKAGSLIKWENVGRTVTGYVDAFAGCFNGLVKRVDWRLIGDTFGEGVNTLVYTAQRLLTQLDLAALGRSLAEALDGLAQTLDFGALGDALARLLTVKLSVIGSALAAIDWEKLAEKLAEGFNSLVRRLGQIVDGIDWAGTARRMTLGLNRLIGGVDWAAAGEWLADRVNDLFAVLGAAFVTFDWEGCARGLAKALNRMAARVDWAGVGSAVNALLTGALNGAIGFLDGFDAEAFARGLRAALDGVRWGEVAQKAWELLRVAFEKLGGFAAALLGDGDGDALGRGLGDAMKGALNWLDRAVAAFDWRGLGARIREMLDKVDWSGVREALEKLLGDLLSGLGELVLGLVMKGGVSLELIRDALDLLAPGGPAGRTGGERARGTTDRNTQALRENTEAVRQRDGSGEAPGRTGLGAALRTGLALARGAVGQLVTVDVDYQPNVVGGAQYKNNRLLDYLQKVFAPGATTENKVQLVRDGFTTIAGWLKDRFMGGGVEKGVGVTRSGWTSVGGWIRDGLMGGAVEKGVGLVGDFGSKNATVADWLKNSQLGGAVEKGIGLVRDFGRKNTTVADWLKNTQLGGAVEKGVGLVRDGFGNIATWLKDNFMGGGVNKGIGLGSTGWKDIAAWLLGGFMGGDVLKAIGLGTTGWGTIAKWLIAGFMGGDVLKAIGLGTTGWGTIAKWLIAGMMGGDVSKGIGLDPTGWRDIARWLLGGFMGGNVDKGIGLSKDGWTWVSDIANRNMGGPVGQLVNLAKQGWDWVDSWAKQFAQSPIQQEVELVKKPNNKITWTAYNKNGNTVELAGSGGVATAHGLRRFAEGGVIRGGVGRWWNGIPRYASGTARAHGTMFLAGEAGPEIIGHVNGKTEILNQSQLAQTMRAAVAGGMLSALRGIEFRMPAMATGGVMPYEVSAQIARSAEDLRGTLNDNNEDLIQTIISVAGQIVAALNRQGGAQAAGGLTARQMIDEINRRTQMFSESPLKGV